MKISKFLKTNKIPVLITSGVLLVGAAGGSYYLATKQDTKFNQPSTIENDTKTPADETTTPTTQTTTPTATTPNPTLSALTDVSLSILLDTDNTQAYVYLYGPAGTYGLETLVSGSWQAVSTAFTYSGHGGSKQLAIIPSTAATTHYRVYKIVNGARTAVSGDTIVTWQEILNNGTLTVPLAR